MVLVWRQSRGGGDDGDAADEEEVLASHAIISLGKL